MSKFTIWILEKIFVSGLLFSGIILYLSEKLVKVSNKIGWKFGFNKGLNGMKYSINLGYNWTEKFTGEMV